MNSVSELLFNLGRFAFAGLLLWLAFSHAMVNQGIQQRATSTHVVADALESKENLNLLQETGNRSGVLQRFQNKFSSLPDAEREAVEEKIDAKLEGKQHPPFGLKKFAKWLDTEFGASTKDLLSLFWPLALAALAIISLACSRRWFTWIIRLSIGAWFIYSGVSKLFPETGIEKFIEQLGDYKDAFLKLGADENAGGLLQSIGNSSADLMTAENINFFASTFPVAEIIAGVLVMILPLRAKPATLILLTLLTMFTGAVLLAVLAGEKIACGCSDSEEVTDWIKVAKNSAVILALLAVLIYRPRDKYNELVTGRKLWPKFGLLLLLLAIGVGGALSFYLWPGFEGPAEWGNAVFWRDLTARNIMGALIWMIPVLNLMFFAGWLRKRER